MLVGERLTGLGMVLAGLLVLGLLRLVSQTGLGLLVQPTPPPGFPPGAAAMFSPLACVTPMLGLGAFGLIAFGLKRMVYPDR